MLQELHGQEPEVVNVKTTVKSAFEEVQCFLMPRPSEEVMSDPNYDGNFSGRKNSLVLEL